MSRPAATAAYRSDYDGLENLSIYRKLGILRNLRSIKTHWQSQVFTVYVQVANMQQQQQQRQDKQQQ